MLKITVIGKKRQFIQYRKFDRASRRTVSANSYTAIEQKVSNYPIFVFQRPSQTILGKRIIDQTQNKEKWNIFITHLEELYHKKVVVEDKLEDFKFQYKNNHDKYCILLIESEEEYSFLFTPIIY